MLKELYEKLKTVGIPVAYYQFPVGNAPDLPYICYFVTGTDNFFADSKTYEKISEVSIELYTKEKDFALQETLENAISDYAWNIEGEEYLDSEGCWDIVYNLEV